MTVDPSNYSRDSSRPNATIHARYAGPCANCEEHTQATILRSATSRLEGIWIRCKDCGSPTYCTPAGSEDSTNGGTIA